ncbi:MAG: AMP-binding protein [Syntrophales bacterium]
MSLQPWPTSNWPTGVPREISGYDKPLFSFLDDSARKYPDNTYTIFNGAQRSFAKVKDTADRVAIFLPNIPHYPEIYFGILKSGAVCVTCNPLYTVPELNVRLKDSGAKAVFCMDHESFYPVTVEAVKNTAVETVVICNLKSYLPRAVGLIGRLMGKIPKAAQHEPGHLMFDDAVKFAKPDSPALSIDPIKDLACIIYTAGTTGVPKGACLTHANFVFDVMAVHEWVRIPHEEGSEPEKLREGGFHCFRGVLPWYHCYGMTMILACKMGSRLVCIPNPRDGKPPFTVVLESVQKYKTTIVQAVPTIYVAFTNHPLLKKFDITSIMGCASCGAPLPVEVARQFEEKTGAIISEGYGLSETAPLATMNPSDAKLRKLGSVGFPIPNTDVRIVDLETGRKELPRGEDGEIAISGPEVMVGYWKNREESEAVFREIEGRHYFLTGDIGHIDDEGYIIITDRKKDMILVGGFNCYPREVEEALFEYPKIALTAVVGLPDPVNGEAAKAFVQLKPGETATEQEIREFCKERLAGYKNPRYVEFRDALPVSPIGKVLRRVLRDEELKKPKKK